MASVTGTIEGSDTELIVAAKYGFAKLNKSTGAVSYIYKVDSDDQAKQEMYIIFVVCPSVLTFC